MKAAIGDGDGTIREENERAGSSQREDTLEVAAITADKQLEISPKEEFSGNGAAEQKRVRAQRKLTAKGKKGARERSYVAYRGGRREVSLSLSLSLSSLVLGTKRRKKGNETGDGEGSRGRRPSGEQQEGECIEQ